MNKDVIKRAVAATVAIGYYDGTNVPTWLGTGFLISGGQAALTCSHLFKEDILEIVEEGVRKRLCALLFWSTRERAGFHSLKVTSIAKLKPMEFGSTYWGDNPPDVAYLRLEIPTRNASGSDAIVSSLEIEKDFDAEVGDEVIITGFPSTQNLVARGDGTPNAIEPLVQFSRIAGILPNSNAPLPHFFALDKIVAFGSSGSPVIKLSDGKVIGMIAGLLPMLWQDKVFEPKPGDSGFITRDMLYNVPTGIGYAVPSNFFYEISQLPMGVGTFEISNRRRIN